jgi:hypothetical protein
MPKWLVELWWAIFGAPEPENVREISQEELLARALWLEQLHG